MYLSDVDKLNKVTRIVRTIIDEMGWERHWGRVESWIVENQERVIVLYDSIADIVREG